MTLNFRALGTRYSPVLLCFVLLLLGGLALHSSASWPLTATGRSASIPEILANSDAASNRPSVRVDLGQLPLRFEPNQGQTDRRVNFLARGAGYGLFLTPDQAVLTLHSPSSSPSVVRMQLAGANRAASATGLARFPVRATIRRQRPGQLAPRHSAICSRRYQDVYPGVDLVYYGNQGQLEYDFEVAPGADPAQSRGASRVRIK